jgi:hypothetical protein
MHCILDQTATVSGPFFFTAQAGPCIIHVSNGVGPWVLAWSSCQSVHGPLVKKEQSRPGRAQLGPGTGRLQGTLVSNVLLRTKQVTGTLSKS